jgi:hypothetical protein
MEHTFKARYCWRHQIGKEDRKQEPDESATRSVDEAQAQREQDRGEQDA